MRLPVGDFLTSTSLSQSGEPPEGWCRLLSQTVCGCSLRSEIAYLKLRTFIVETCRSRQRNLSPLQEPLMATVFPVLQR